MTNKSAKAPDSDLIVPLDGSFVRFFSKENTARIGRFIFPLPFSAFLELLMIPVLFVAAAVSMPVTFFGRYITRRREARFTAQMKAVERCISWAQASSRVADCGTFIEEYFSFKGPYRLWCTSESISKISPHPCCYEEMPWGSDEGISFLAFFEWCRSRFTDPAFGTASIVDVEEERKDVRKLLDQLRDRSSCVCIASGYLKDSPPETNGLT